MTAHNDMLTRIIEYYRKGNLKEAEKGCQKLLHKNPCNAEAHFLIGAVFNDTGRLSEAEAAYREAVKYKPDHAGAHQNLGALLHSSGRLDEAVTCYKKTLAVQPDNQAVEYNLAHACFAQKKHAMAVAHFRNILAANPGSHEVLFNLGRALSARGDLTEAIECYQQAINLKPDYTDALNNLGTLLMSRGRLSEAINSFGLAMKNTPDNPKLHFNMGVALKENGQYVHAADSFRQSLKLAPDFPKAYAELCRCNQTICEWRSTTFTTGKLLEITEDCLNTDAGSPVYPFDSLSLPFTAEILGKIASSHARTISMNAGVNDLGVNSRKTGKGARLRIGYVSQKFNNHAGAHLIASLFGLHDRNKFQIFAYSIGENDNSIYRQRIEQGCENFIDVAGQSFIDIAQRIHDNGINILIDLGVYNTHAMTEIFALRPAPVQVSYLGFPGTSGSDFYDYILTDRTVTPPDQQQWFSEKFAYLPNCYQVNDHQLEIQDEIPDRTACQLPEDAFVFCSFNNSYKIEPVMFDVWMNILTHVPNSVLWLLEHTRETTFNLCREAESRGIDSERLVFAGKKPKDLHLARHRHADLFLDTLIYNAHTTASDSLRVGVPVLTAPGTTFASRVAASLLKAVDLPEMVANNLTDYRDIAIQYATNKSFMKDIKDKLSSNIQSSPLFDTPSFARHLECAYKQMWNNHTSGNTALQITVSQGDKP